MPDFGSLVRQLINIHGMDPAGPVALRPGIFRSPAVQINGQVFEAPNGRLGTHWDAAMAARQALGDATFRDPSASTDYGFVTQDGKFVSGPDVEKAMPFGGVPAESNVLRRYGLLGSAIGAVGSGLYQFNQGFNRGLGLPDASQLNQIAASKNPVGKTAETLYQNTVPSEDALHAMLSDPPGFLRDFINNLRQNPAAGAGGLAGMFAGGIHPDDLPGALRYGGQQLTNATRRVSSADARIAAERSTMGGEGAITSGSLDIGPVAAAGESPGDIAAGFRNLPDKTIQTIFKLQRQNGLTPTNPTYQLFLNEMQRRGLRPDFSPELQQLHEGPPGAISPPPRTASDIGGEMLDRQGPPGFDIREPSPSREQHLTDRLREMFPGNRYPGSIQAVGPFQFREASGDAIPPGTTFGIGGKQAVAGGQHDWTISDNPPRPQDLEYLLPKSPSMQDFVSHVAMNMRMQPPYLNMADPPGSRFLNAAQRMTAAIVNMRMQAGTAAPREVAWLDRYQALNP